MTILAIALTATVVGLGAALWSQRPEMSSGLAVAMAFLPAAWAGVWLLDRVCGHGSEPFQGRQVLIRAIASAGCLLAISLGVAWAKELGLLEGDASERVVGVALGMLLVLMGNAMPKTLAPLSSLGSHPARAQATQRFMGWLFVVAGLLYASVWLLLDIGQTGVATLLTFPAACLILVVSRRAMRWIHE